MPAFLLQVASLLAGSGAGQAQTIEERLGTCLACHGSEGTSEQPGVPSLGGQPTLYVAMQLYFFREGRRPATVMTETTRGLSDDELRELSERVSGLPAPQAPEKASDQERYERGAVLAREHRCQSCHGRDLSGRDQVPRIAPQREDYSLRSLAEYKSGRRIGHGASMPEVVAPLSEADLADLAHFLAHFRP
ncbi:c-type cytochrome [Arenibaculum pallidiluteum]|uniref:c-type cytochrome n=1 Tax=Arenibaculum pallidiluteum TaxID=2812559 RepID=UPI001A96866E|nr:c-type cytochrome [Arenibaculum pallidiluteum]